MGLAHLVGPAVALGLAFVASAAAAQQAPVPPAPKFAVDATWPKDVYDKLQKL